MGPVRGAQSLVVSQIETHVAARVWPGEVLLQISDRPLFVLAGPVPAFRDMIQGDSGQDIAELQAALGELGYSCAGDPTGTFGTATAAAVRRYYAAIGFGVPLIQTPSGEGAAGSESGKHSSARQLVEVPMSEVMFVPSFPATVTALPTTVGEQVTSPLVSVALGELDLTGQLDPADAGQVRAGMRVQVLSDTTGRQVSGVVTSVGQVVSPRQASPYLPVRIRPLRHWQDSWAGQNVQLTVTSAATSRPVLAVPEAAISADANAVTYVTVAEGRGTFRRVRVRVGVAVDGLVAVIPIAGGLSAGDRVVVGT
jgi:peptidoglycan hydrolase-like protein with peptidoglycan-binding domain